MTYNTLDHIFRDRATVGVEEGRREGEREHKMLLVATIYFAMVRLN